MKKLWHGCTGVTNKSNETLNVMDPICIEPVFASRPEIVIPKEVQNSVVKLQAPNANAREGHTDVFVLGMSHVSHESVKAVRSLIESVKPEVCLHVHSSDIPFVSKLPGSVIIQFG